MTSARLRSRSWKERRGPGHSAMGPPRRAVGLFLAAFVSAPSGRSKRRCKRPDTNTGLSLATEKGSVTVKVIDRGDITCPCKSSALVDGVC